MVWQDFELQGFLRCVAMFEGLYFLPHEVSRVLNPSAIILKSVES